MPSNIYDYDTNPILDLIVDPDWDTLDRAQLHTLLRHASAAWDVDALRDMLDERED